MQRFAVAVLFIAILAPVWADDVPMECRILGSSSQGGYLIKLEKPAAVQISDVLRIVRDGQVLGEAWVIKVQALDGTAVIQPRFNGQIRSTDNVFFVRHVKVLGRPADLQISDGNEPIDEKERATADRGTAAAFKQFGPVSRDSFLASRLDGIGQRIAKTSPRSRLHWTFEVLESNQINALTVGFGRIYVTRALMEILDDEELAGAVAHEVAHGCLRHLQRKGDTADIGKMYLDKAKECMDEADRISKEATFSPEMRAMRVTSKRSEADEWLVKAKSVVHRLENWNTGDAWDDEYEADHKGMLYARQAGYRPQGLIDCLHKLATGSRTEFFVPAAVEGASDHPPMAKRIEIAEKISRGFQK